MVGSMDTARAEHAQGTPTQSRISPNILVHEENVRRDASLAATRDLKSAYFKGEVVEFTSHGL